MSAVSIEKLSVHYSGAAAPAVRDASLEVAPGELHVLLGQSGSGKTTLLRAVAGFERASSGRIRIGETVVDGGKGGPWLPPERRGVGVVFQDYALFPHLNVLKNIGFSGASMPRCTELLDLVGLVGYEKRAIAELSGGEQQRVALARALAQDPKLILLDEPFSNLDPSLRHELRAETVRVLRSAKATGLFVTHDREEAFALADRLSVIHESRILQSGTPQDLYDSPAASQVATALGDVCLLAATQRDDGRVDTILGPLETRGSGKHAALRPEQIHVSDAGVSAEVVSCHYAGGHWSITATAKETTFRFHHSACVSGTVSITVIGTVALVPN